MDLTRERWCCAWGLCRLAVNACHRGTYHHYIVISRYPTSWAYINYTEHQHPHQQVNYTGLRIYSAGDHQTYPLEKKTILVRVIYPTCCRSTSNLAFQPQPQGCDYVVFCRFDPESVGDRPQGGPFVDVESELESQDVNL